MKSALSHSLGGIIINIRSNLTVHSENYRGIIEKRSCKQFVLCCAYSLYAVNYPLDYNSDTHKKVRIAYKFSNYSTLLFDIKINCLA